MSQIRCNIEDSDHRFVGWIIPNIEAIFQDGGKYEVWVKNDDFAGYVIVLNGEGNEGNRGLAKEYAIDLKNWLERGGFKPTNYNEELHTVCLS